MAHKIALSMIVKGDGKEPEHLDRALQSVAGFVDGIFITVTGEDTAKIEEVASRYGAVITKTDARIEVTQEMVDSLTAILGYKPICEVGDKIFRFDTARNFNMSNIPSEYDWLLWMDCDDVLLRGENLRALVDETDQNKVEAYYCNYLYQVELEKGEIKNVLIQHLRERLVKNAGLFSWVAPIHETLIEKRPTQKMETNRIEILHLANIEERRASLQRNLRTLEYAIYLSKGEDPRHIYYLAKALFDLCTPEDNEKAKKLILEGYIGGKHPSGWPEERAQAWEYLAEIYRREGEHNNAIKCCMNALIEAPETPSIFINIATSYMIKKDWERAIFWVKQASAVPAKATTLVVNPKDIQARTLEIIYNCCLNLSRVDEAWAAAQKLVGLFPDNETVFKSYQFVEMIRQQRELTKDVLKLSNYLQQTGEAGKIKALLSAIPATIKDNPFMMDLYKRNNPPTVWGKKSIAIYCGPGFTPWSPRLMREPQDSFVGGSEEAVILMSEALARKGWQVTVYADPGADEGKVNDVTWLPYYKFNGMDHFNILIGWRDIRFFDGEYDAKKKYLWCHDIQSPIEFTPERVAKITKVMFLSKWHRDNVPDLPEEKVMLTSNGVEL